MVLLVRTRGRDVFFSFASRVQKREQHANNDSRKKNRKEHERCGHCSRPEKKFYFNNRSVLEGKHSHDNKQEQYEDYFKVMHDHTSSQV